MSSEHDAPTASAALAASLTAANDCLASVSAAVTAAFFAGGSLSIDWAMRASDFWNLAAFCWALATRWVRCSGGDSVLVAVFFPFPFVLTARCWVLRAEPCFAAFVVPVVAARLLAARVAIGRRDVDCCCPVSLLVDRFVARDGVLARAGDSARVAGFERTASTRSSEN